MSESGNSTLARRWFEEVWNVRREETVRALMAPAVEGHMEGGLEVHGPEDFIAARSGGNAWNQGRLMQELQAS
jgi:hypothetical protein